MNKKNKLFRKMNSETIEKIKLIKQLEKLKTSSEAIEFLVNNYTSNNEKRILEQIKKQLLKAA